MQKTYLYILELTESCDNVTGLKYIKTLY